MTPSPSSELHPLDFEVKLLTHDEFKTHPAYRHLVQLLADHFQRDRYPGEKFSTYKRSFLGNRSNRQHLMLIHKETGEVLAHYNGIPQAPSKNNQTASIGHLTVKPGHRVGLIAWNKMKELLRERGFTEIRGSHYSRVGSRFASIIGCREMGVTRRGKKFNVPELKYWSIRLE